MAKRKAMTADEFNAKYPIGSPCNYYPIKGGKEYYVTETRSEAWELGHGAAVVAINRVRGGVSIEHLEMLEAAS